MLKVVDGLYVPIVCEDVGQDMQSWSMLQYGLEVLHTLANRFDS